MKRFLHLLLLAVLVSAASSAAVWDEQTYRQIEQSIKAPQIADREFLITKFGAKSTAEPAGQAADAAARNQKAIQKAIDKCSKKGGGRVVVPAGQTFLTGAIQLKSGVSLEVQEGAVLRFAFQPELYPIVETSWEGLDCYNLSPCVYAYQATDIALTGKGTIDGGGSRETWWPWCGSPRYGWEEGTVSQKIEARPRLLKNGDESFDHFDLSLYPDTPEPDSGCVPREAMAVVFAGCKKFADRFPDVSSNLLLRGDTGLGKTYLSACIARVVSGKGFSVCYDTAAAALEKYELAKFSRDTDEGEDAAVRIRRMESCDLMILDDLGTEMATPFADSALYTLINTRLNEGKKTIISTNLGYDELERRYTAQIFSRLRGSFERLPFVGRDIRLIKR